MTMSKNAELMSTAPFLCRDTCPPIGVWQKFGTKTKYQPSSGVRSLFFACGTKILLLAASSTTHSL